MWLIFQFFKNFTTYFYSLLVQLDTLTIRQGSPIFKTFFEAFKDAKFSVESGSFSRREATAAFAKLNEFLEAVLSCVEGRRALVTLIAFLNDGVD